MAIAAQGLTFTYGSDTLQEIEDLEVNTSRIEQDAYSRDRRVGPVSTGTLALRGYSIAGLKQDRIGTWRVMTITVRTSPTTVMRLWHGWARYDQCVVNATRNGAVLFAFRFTLWAASSSSGTVIAG